MNNDKLKKELTIVDDKNVLKSFYYDMNAIYFWSDTTKKWYWSYTVWVDDYEKMLSDRNGLRVAFEGISRKVKEIAR